MNAQGDIGPITMYRDVRHALVVYPRSPPKEPPSILQTINRNRWNAAMRQWRALPANQRHAWTTAANAASLRCGGHAFFVHVLTTRNWQKAATVAQQTGITLPIPTHDNP